jgi:hypothetical protein
MTFFEGYITQRIYSADIFRGIANYFTIFLLKTFLTCRPLKVVWANLPTAVRVRVK